MKIPKDGNFTAFSMIVDINGFTSLVAENELSGGIANFVRDVLSGSIQAVEEAGGSVIGINGDSVFGILPDADRIVQACVAIAKDVDSQCSYLDKTGYKELIPKLPSMKIGVEYGLLAASTITTEALGTLPFCIGPATNYAARIIAAGKGNRCHIGPKAFDHGLNQYFSTSSILEVPGKRGEPPYQYRQLSMSDVWIEGTPEDGICYWD